MHAERSRRRRRRSAAPWRGRDRGAARRRTAARLTMTSMMDIFTVLLLFLLKNFVADPQVIAPHPGVDLPVSETTNAPEESPVVVVTPETILVAEEPVVGRRELGEADERALEPLRASLAAMRQHSARLRRLRGQPADDPYRLTVQGDQEIPFATLEKVLYTAHLAGYQQISLATRRD